MKLVILHSSYNCSIFLHSNRSGVRHIHDFHVRRSRDLHGHAPHHGGCTSYPDHNLTYLPDKTLPGHLHLPELLGTA